MQFFVQLQVVKKSSAESTVCRSYIEFIRVCDIWEFVLNTSLSPERRFRKDLILSNISTFLLSEKKKERMQSFLLPCMLLYIATTLHPASGAHTSTFTRSNKARIINIHNFHRATTTYPAANMMRMYWSNTLVRLPLQCIVKKFTVI